MSTAELTEAPAIELARLVREGAVSAVELVEAHLRRIEAVGAQINAVVQVDAERALEAARRAPSGPLGGVPFTWRRGARRAASGPTPAPACAFRLTSAAWRRSSRPRAGFR